MPRRHQPGPVVTVAEMQAAEQAIFAAGTSVGTLMHIAGTGAAEIVWRVGGRTPTLVLCGRGNNGGDGYVIAEYLRDRGVPVQVAAAGEPKTEAAAAARAAYGGVVVSLDQAQRAAQCVDCLFGSGLNRPVDDALWAPFAAAMRRARRRIAIDLPSGIDSDRAELLNAVPPIDITIALGAWKQAHLLEPAASHMGVLTLVDIGADFAGHRAWRLAQPRFSAPSADANKYRRGLVQILAGAMPGAALLAARAAQSAGAGYVRIAGMTPPPAGIAADMVWQQAEDAAAMAALLDDARIGALLVGPGLGRDAAAETLLDQALAAAAPLVIDADALHLLTPRRQRLRARSHAVVLTPHHGEFTVLAQDIGAVGEAGDKIARTRAAARALGAHVVYKGADTVLAAPGHDVIIADRASPWLSVAGSGDVLAGTIAARLATGSEPLDALAEAHWLHRRAAMHAGPAFTAAGLAQAIAPALAESLA